MNIEQAAELLDISPRHVRRLIKNGDIPAKRVKVQKIVEIYAWDISDDVVKAAGEALDEMFKYDNFGEWMTDIVERLGLTWQDLAKRTKLPIWTLEEVARMPGHLSGSNVDIEEKIGKVLVRADIERRCANARK